MKKKSKSIDRLSELPDSLIFAIFGLLPMRTVAQTSTLSKHWRNLWTTAPCLNFVDNEKPKFITRALMFWRGTKILKVKIELSSELDYYTATDIDSWLRFAEDYEVRELYLHLAVRSGIDVDEELYLVPQYLFSSCPSLQVLSLKGCGVYIRRNVQWKQLKSLTISPENGLRDDDIDCVLCGSPQLEVLVLRFYDTREHLTIRSTSLKKLSIDKFIDDVYDEPPMNTRLTICAPNLATLEISNLPYYFCLLEDVSSLTDVALLFDHSDYADSVLDLFNEASKQVLPKIQHVGNVTLSYWCFMALSELKREHLVPSLWDVKFLKLNASFPNDADVVCALEIFSNVEMLVLEDVSDEDYVEEKVYLDFQPSLPNLRRIEVIWSKVDYTIFQLIEILLKYATKLETMVFRATPVVVGIPASDAWSVAAKELLKMPRCSPTAKLILCD